MTITSLSKAVIARRSEPGSLERLESVRVARAVVEVRVANPVDKWLPVGECGEVLVGGDTALLGYWNDAEATAQTLRRGSPYTGDLGVIDESGHLTLKAGSEDLIISGGLDIYSREIKELSRRLSVRRQNCQHGTSSRTARVFKPQ